MNRGLVSPTEWATTRTRLVLRALQGLLLGALLLTGLGPVLWLAKAAVTPTQDTLREPLSVFPHGLDLANLATAWTRVEIDKYFLNTVWLAVGSWAVQLLVATTAGYALAVLRPRYGGLITAVVLGTLFVPSIVLLVPLYLTVVDAGMINTFWAVWLPAGASAFNVVLVQRFFASLPREVFEAARVDGAGPFRIFWSVVLPLSRPIIGVVSVFAVVASWKDFLWPMLVLPDPAVQPLSVRLPALQRYVELDVFLAALAISSIIPIALFLVFQRLFLHGGALEGAVKG
ncbi:MULTISPECIES: carbohydrate ABC transporter permease [Saccharothrix]|uniref:carbohydrate ABC transporter permease n=1 Tax=Saccharothrix TaxID=2071 RepID=UPI00093D9AA6|nr:carbohydrate ABC transporter permease [Saccharothrix sp. CB00851]OKI18645.1 ABC transporter permease [Saccharothrix sp. CB00851]